MSFLDDYVRRVKVKQRAMKKALIEERKEKRKAFWAAEREKRMSDPEYLRRKKDKRNAAVRKYRATSSKAKEYIIEYKKKNLELIRKQARDRWHKKHGKKAKHKREKLKGINQLSLFEE
jgi:hypothetical protein